MDDTETIEQQIQRCTICQAHLPLTPRPIIQVSSTAKILIIGQAPGIKAHDSGKPWNDASGLRLREWLGIDNTTFYDKSHIAIVPMGFCYPGRGKSGDIGPRKECAPLWHTKLIQSMPISVTMLIGQYAQNYYLKDKLTLTKRVENWKSYLPQYFVLPHPSPRNNIWLKKNLWFENEVVPEMQQTVKKWLS